MYVPASNPTSLLAVALAMTRLNCVAGVTVVFVNLKLPALLDAMTFGILALLILLTMSVIVYVTNVDPEEVNTIVDTVNAVEVFAINQSLTSSVYVPADIKVCAVVISPARTVSDPAITFAVIYVLLA
jgi:hypothetical protein